MISEKDLITFYLKLTPRQREVLELTSQGLRNSEIARHLTVESCVVAGHLTNIYAELGTLEAFADLHPNRYTIILVFAGFFDRNPYLSTFSAVR